MSQRLVLPARGEVIADSVVEASSIRSRMRGLLARPTLRPNEALLLIPCKQVHTFGMTYAIDVVFCDRSWVVLRVVRGMRPARLSRVVWRSHVAVELRAGGAVAVQVGDRLKLEDARL
jgi:uncharacterized membrane protein (UPF0127 family)